MSVTVYVTNHCQHRCAHCFLTRHDTLNQRHIDIGQLRQFLATLSREKVALVAVSGGDPFLHPEIETILKDIQSFRMRPLIAANPSPALFAHFDLLISLKIPTLQFSLDSAKPSSHDAVRGRNSYNQTLLAIRTLQSRGVRCNLSICITKRNQHEIIELLSLARHLEVFKVKLVFWRDDLAPNANNWVLSEAQQICALSQIYETACRFGDVAWVTVPGFDLTTQQRRLERYPELVLQPNGFCSIGETGQSLGAMHDSDLAAKYNLRVRQIKAACLGRLFDQMVKTLGIRVKRHKVTLPHAAGTVLRLGNEFRVLTHRALSPVMSEIIALHELGHIATNTLCIGVKDQTQTQRAGAERLANLWVLSQLAPFMRRLSEKLTKTDPASDQFYALIESEIDSNYSCF